MMNWPDKPTCHDADYQAKRFGPQRWERRAPDARNPDGEPFRRCSYCGSIHPEDFIAAIDAGAQLGGSDWKYGWPHKFYLMNIPNPNKDRQAEIGGISQWDEATQASVFTASYGAEGNFHAKWYNVHLQDAYDDEARARILARIKAASHIEFAFDADGRMKYSAPYQGYQV